MERSKHGRRSSFVPRSPLRWLAAAVGVWSLVATAVGDQPRYSRVVGFALALVLIAVGTLPVEHRLRARAAVLGLMTVLLGVAGVAASISIDEAMTLVAAAIVSGTMACFFAGVPRRPKHSAPGA